MKYRKILVVFLSILFFLTALTIYLNRVVFPRLIKKIAVERIEEVLKRKVEIGSIHFNWIRGFVVDKIKIYDKNPSGTVFAQAQQVSFGILFFPGLKHYRITIPYITVLSPSVHFIRTAADTWNFSDILPASSAPAAGAAAPKPSNPSPFEIAWGGISISNGKLLVEDASKLPPWSEFFDNINLKLSLSYKGISYDFSADIPGKKGLVGATVYYQPLTRNTEAHIHLKNIDTASYLSLFNIPDVQIKSGKLEDIDLNINYSKEKTSAQGNVSMKDFDITSNEQSFKGDVEIRGLNAQYKEGDISARGQIILSNIQTKVPGLSAGGSVQARVNDFEFTKQGATFIGWLHGQHIFVALKDRQVQVEEADLDNIKVRKDKDGIQSVGGFTVKGLVCKWPDQTLQGDFSLKSLIMHMKDENNIWMEGDLLADNLTAGMAEKSLKGRHIQLEGIRLNITDQKNIALETRLSADQMTLSLGDNLQASASIKTDKVLFKLDEGMIKMSSHLVFSQSKLVLDKTKTIEADPRLELNLQMPLNSPQELVYKGSITLSDGSLKGFGPFKSLEGVELDADFQNDQASINALSLNILDTNVRINGSVKDFKDPLLNLIVEADELDLAKIKDLMPQLVSPYGLNFDGEASLKVKFEGLFSDPLAAKVLAVATVKGANVSSSKFNQKINNITGILEATTDSLKWRDTTAIYQGKTYSLSGSLENFKNPKVLMDLVGPQLAVKADLAKNNDLITINSLTVKYLNIDLESTGTVTLVQGDMPRFDLNSNASLLLEDLVMQLPSPQKKSIQPLRPTGLINLTANLKGNGLDWKNYLLNASVTCPLMTIEGYKLKDLKMVVHQQEGMVKDLTFNGNFYDGTVHAVGSLDLTAKGMPFELALNVDNTDLHQLKVDSPFKMEEINGKFFLTTLTHGTLADFKNTLTGNGSMAIRDGYLAEFNLFKGLLGILNDALRLGQVMITDVQGNFTLADQKINTDNLRLSGPTIVLLSKGWVNFNQDCDLNITVDLSSGVVPAIAHDALNTLQIRVYDKIGNPKFKKKISVPQVINSLLKNFLQ